MKRFFLIILAACLFFTGCGNHETEETFAETDEAEKTVLEFYTWQDEKNYMTKVVNAFMEDHPDIVVNPHFIPSSEYGQTISVLHNIGGGTIDLFAESKPSASAADVKRNYVMDITQLFDAGGEKARGYAEMMESLKINGKVYMIPYRKSTWAVYYNKTIFDEAGIPYPEGEWTWEDYTELARKLTKEEDGRRIYGSISFETGSMWWRTPVRTAGIENRMTEEGLEMYKKAAWWNYQMAYEYRAQPAFTELTDVSSYDYVSRFLRGDIAMIYCGDWCMEIIAQQMKARKMDFEYDVAPLPGPVNSEKYMPVTSAVLQVSARSEHPKEALMLAEYISGEKGAEILAENGILPAWDTEPIREILRNNIYAPEHIQCFWDYDKAVYTFPNEEMDEALEIVNRYVGQYFLKEISLDTAFENIRSILRERKLIAENEK